jgi:hypothetical protein
MGLLEQIVIVNLAILAVVLPFMGLGWLWGKLEAFPRIQFVIIAAVVLLFIRWFLSL